MPRRTLSTLPRRGRHSLLGVAALLLSVAACGGSGDEERSVTLASTGPNVVSYWNDIANKTVNATSAVNTTAEERRPSYHVDLATVHVAIYDAVSAIDGRYEPFAITPAAPAAGASLDAAASAAAYGVLRALFPNRGAQYEAAYVGYISAIPTGDAKSKGLALGSEVAAGVVALRANDGRSVALAPYVSSSAPGKFRSDNPTPFNRYVPFIKTFSLTRVDQFRPAAPPPLESAVYAADLNQSKAVGGTVSGSTLPICVRFTVPSCAMMSLPRGWSSSRSVSFTSVPCAPRTTVTSRLDSSAHCANDACAVSSISSRSRSAVLPSNRTDSAALATPENLTRPAIAA